MSWLPVFYKRLISPLLLSLARPLGIETHCKFHPTCSEYAATALAVHGPARGSALTIARLCRCHPWSRGGLDLVPSPKTPHSSSLAR